MKPPTEFEAEGALILPWCGRLALTGGSGPWSWELRTDDTSKLLAKQNYRPTWRSLTQFVTAGTTFAVPQYHTRIGVLNGTATVTDVETGVKVTLDRMPAPVNPGQEFQVAPGGTLPGIDLLVFFMILL